MKKKIRYASVATVATIVCIVAAILINILFTSLDKRFDLSADFSGSRITGIDSVSVDIVGRIRSRSSSTATRTISAARLTTRHSPRIPKRAKPKRG